jgi:hypothetical protein
MEINQSGTSGGKAAAAQPGGDVINISVVVEKKDDIKDALDVVGQVANFIPGISPKLPSLPVAPEPKPEPSAPEPDVPVFPDDVEPEGQIEEVD